MAVMLEMFSHPPPDLSTEKTRPNRKSFSNHGDPPVKTPDKWICGWMDQLPANQSSYHQSIHPQIHGRMSLAVVGRRIRVSAIRVPIFFGRRMGADEWRWTNGFLDGWTNCTPVHPSIPSSKNPPINSSGLAPEKNAAFAPGLG